MEDWAPPLIHGTWLMTHSMMSCAARVAMARYRPLMRREGMPNRTPTSALVQPPARMPNQNGMP